MTKISEETCGLIPRLVMPKEMSDWFDFMIEGQHYAVVESEDNKHQLERKGYAMKTRDCTVVFYPHWNCNTQFKNIVNKLR